VFFCSVVGRVVGGGGGGGGGGVKKKFVTFRAFVGSLVY